MAFCAKEDQCFGDTYQQDYVLRLSVATVHHARIASQRAIYRQQIEELGGPPKGLKLDVMRFPKFATL